MKNNENIIVKGARVNNLKNVDVEIPRGKLVVVTGVSGSGKSSLAFDTLYAEGQRRYVESLSAYARQFLGRMNKPECDYIKGLPPAIAIEQKVNTRNPRSTVGTATEIYDYLRMLFARVGQTISPVSGVRVQRFTPETVAKATTKLPVGTRIAILAPLQIPYGRTDAQQLDILLKEGYSRLEHDGEFEDISDILTRKKIDLKGFNLLIDRLAISDDHDEESRLASSIETAWYEGDGKCIVKAWEDDGVHSYEYTGGFNADGMEFREPTDLMFNFNNPYGACPTCEGFGKVMGIDEDLVIPDKTKSIYEDAVQCFRGEKMGECKQDLIRVAAKYKFPIHTPYCDLTQEQKDFLWHGANSGNTLHEAYESGDWYGIDGFFAWVDQNQYKIQYRVLKARYRGKRTCPTCGGKRLRPDAEYVKVGGKSITELVTMSIDDLREFFMQLQLDHNDTLIAERLLTEIRNRLSFLQDVGLGYLRLDRLSSTLSGGESQRINLATTLGSSLVGSLYILDEPSIGLHPRDTDRLIKVLRSLQQLGNTVVIVEHDEEIMRMADYIIDIGKDAGRLGGNLVYAGPIKDALNEKVSDAGSYTLRYLRGKLDIPVPKFRLPWHKFIEVQGPRQNNLKGMDVRFPLGVMTVVTGVSGSGKSTLVKDILYKALKRRLDEVTDAPGTHKGLSGDLDAIKHVEFVDQNPIGTSTRSNAATYLKAYDEIRRLFAETPLARQLGFTPSYFSFNTDGGRCDECKGEGIITIPMQFMADISVPCPSCNGKRFKQDVLDIKYRDKNIDDILDMTVNQAIEFFNESGTAGDKRVVRKLKPLADVGLGYIKLGQNSSSLSGGENQRVKLAYYLSQEKSEPTLFIFDEPTTGLHFNDISTLLKSLRALVERGHTVLIIEHNLDVIKCADHIIDIGPEGGNAGGKIVAVGTPEQVAQNAESYTGKFLKEKLLEQ
ncbi:MAG: excinuclease ABC subunit UvrA [Muribaculaceae bacterium]|nr:excinuclease ABC subunit UvrA [Muribaculaceae bacterium]